MDNKKTQKYRLPKQCQNCVHFKVITDYLPIPNSPSFEVKEKTCGLGGFVVEDTATCNKFKQR
jgi:hypothetical protein